jgi:hypothetical protein
MGSGRKGIIGLIFNSKKQKQKQQGKHQQAVEKERKEYARTLALHGSANDPNAVEARQQLMADKQRRTEKRAKMTFTDRPGASVDGGAVLLPNSTSHSLATQGHVDNGVVTQVWVLGDGGHAALQLVAVDMLSLFNWIDAHANCGIVCRFDDPYGDGGAGPPVARHIYAHPRLIYRTSKAGTALQPGWEVAKQTAQNLGSFAGPSNELVEGATAILTTVVEQRRMHQVAPQTPQQKKLKKAKDKVQEKLQDDSFKVDEAKVWVAIEFGLAPGKDGVLLGNASWYFRQANTADWHKVTSALSKMWSGE